MLHGHAGWRKGRASYDRNGRLSNCKESGVGDVAYSSLHILLITTASLINTTYSGIFKNNMDDRKRHIVDEASQTPEPLSEALSTPWHHCCHMRASFTSRISMSYPIRQVSPWRELERHRTVRVRQKFSSVPSALITSSCAHSALNGLTKIVFYHH